MKSVLCSLPACCYTVRLTAVQKNQANRNKTKKRRGGRRSLPPCWGHEIVMVFIGKMNDDKALFSTLGRSTFQIYCPALLAMRSQFIQFSKKLKVVRWQLISYAQFLVVSVVKNLDKISKFLYIIMKHMNLIHINSFLQ